MNRFKKFVVLAPVFFLILCSLSQSVSFSDEQLLAQYNKADGFYRQATELGFSPQYSEDKESELNHAALAAYGVFLKNLSATTKRLDSLKYQAAFKSGELQHYFERFPEAISGYSLAIETVRQNSLPDSLLFKPYLFSGILYYGKNKFDSAAFYFQKAEIVLKKHRYQLSEKERLYNAYGVLQYERGDYRQAKNFFLKAIETLSKDHAYRQELLTNYEVNLAQIYFKLEDYDQANKMYQELIRKKIHTNEINHNLGLINLYLGAASRSLDYFRRVDYSSNKVIWLYTNMGEAFLTLKEYDSSRHYLQKAITESNNYGTSTDHYALGMALHHYGNLELALAKPQQALEWYQQAIIHLYPGFKNQSVTANPKIFSGVFSYVNLFHALTQKAAALHELYLAKNQVSYAQQELEAFQSAFALADYVSHTYESDEARLFLNKIKYIVHSRPIDIAYELYQKTKNRKYLEDLYQLDQQNKASVLSIRIHSSGVFSDTSSSRERQVKSEINRLSIKASHTTDSVQLASIGKEIRDLEIELGGISDSLEQKNQLFTSIPTITTLQNNVLDHGTALASFHLSENKITRIWITGNDFQVHQQDLPGNFYEDIAAYIAALKNPVNPVKRTGLFNLLFKDISLDKLQQLLIIPDDELNYLPFETLQDNEGKYLIEKCAVQYQYTTALLKKEKLNFSEYETLAMAPYVRTAYRDSSVELPSLPHSLEEIRNLKGKHFYDSSATKRNFLNELNKFKVLHLATHAIVNTHENELSYISFAPDSLKENFLLYAEEIYHLPMQKTDLVILSACETGGGSLVRGEGIMSLSRAFAYAGCSNIITSLWVANDFSTAWLMRRLHFYLDKNYTVDQALQQAKLDYLKDEKINPRLKHPFYWSHLVFVGNHETIRSGPDYRLMLVALLAAVGLFVLVNNFRRKWNSTSSK